MMNAEWLVDITQKVVQHPCGLRILFVHEDDFSQDLGLADTLCNGWQPKILDRGECREDNLASYIPEGLRALMNTAFGAH